MDFEELMQKLEEAEGFGEDAVKAVTERLKKPNNEAKSLRKRMKELEAKLNNNPILDVLKENGLEIDEDSDVKEAVSMYVKSLMDKPNTNNNTDPTKDPAYIKLQKQIDKLTKINEESEKEKAQLQKQNHRTKIENALQKDFSETIANGKALLKLLINSSDSPFIVEDGEIGYKLKDGDVITGTKEIIDEYKKANPDQVLNTAHNGVESRSSSGTLKVPTKFTSKAQIEALSPEQINSIRDSKPEQYAQMMGVLTQK